jgi:hypothetical protein
MKSFSEFQEEMNKKVPPVMSLGGGGGGTDCNHCLKQKVNLLKREL